MSWGAPLVLLGLLVPLALALAWDPRARRTSWLRLVRVEVERSRVRPAPSETSRRPWRLLAALALAVIALAQPRWGAREASSVEPSREILIALDLSRSMLVADVAPSRLHRAQILVRSLLENLPGERVGLIVFAGTAYVQVPLSSDHQILQEFLPVLEPGYLPRGGTDYAGMLRAARDGFSQQTAVRRELVILSDGESTTDGWREEAAQLRQRGVNVIALGIGTAAGGEVPSAGDADAPPPRSRLEATTLQAIAHESGIYRDASETLDVAALLAGQPDESARRRLSSETTHAHAEQFTWFLAPALALGLAGLWREVAVRPRLRAITRTAVVGATSPFGAALLALGAGLVFVVDSQREAHAHDEGHTFGSEATAADKLRWLVDDLTQHRAIDACDLALLAERTVAYGLETLAQGRAVPEGALRDALLAVAHGQRLQPAQADWATLRNTLEGLRARSATTAAERPPEQKKEALDEEDRPSQTNGQGSQQSTSESMGQGGLAKTEATLGELRNERGRRRTEQRPAGGARVGPGLGAGGAGTGSAPDPLRALTLRRYREVVKGDQPAVLFQALAGDISSEPAGGRDW